MWYLLGSERDGGTDHAEDIAEPICSFTVFVILTVVTVPPLQGVA